MITRIDLSPPARQKPRYCRECGEPMFLTDNQISHHASATAPDGIDYDADDDHVAVADQQDEEDDVVRITRRLADIARRCAQVAPQTVAARLTMQVADGRNG